MQKFLGETRLYNEVWEIIIVVDSSSIQDQLTHVQLGLGFADTQCKKNCYEHREKIFYMKYQNV